MAYLLCGRIRRLLSQLAPIGVLWATSVMLVDGFVSPGRVVQRPSPFPSSPLRQSRPTPPAFSLSSLSMMDVSWDELLYSAESAASIFASQSLEDPSAIWSSLPIMYGAGLLTSISPCVWGLLPLTMSYISTAAGERQDKKALFPTLAFAAGLASVFCTLGLVASTVGGVFGGSSGGLSDVAVPLVSSAVCLAMGLQLLGFIQLPLLQLPVSVQKETTSGGEILLDGQGNIVSGSSSTPAETEGNGSSLVRTFLLGGSSALVASPCATPVLTSILAFVAKSQDPILGFILLLGYTLGYSTPLLLVAASGGQALANLRGEKGAYAKVAPWVTPLTAGILLWYGTNGLLTTLFGDPSLAGLAPILE